MTNPQDSFLVYDIRGIQAAIFAVPKLKYIVGGSALVDELDRITVRNLADDHKVKCIYSGGGRGAFRGARVDLESFQKALLAEARGIGLDLRLAIGDQEVLNQPPEDLFPCPPGSLEGEPCRASGLFPVERGKGQGYKDDKRGIHPIIWKRVAAAKKDAVGMELLNGMFKCEDFPQELKDRCAFFRNVSPDEDDDDAEKRMAGAGLYALGNTNRWAILAMDGNDLGKQHLAARTKQMGLDESLAWRTKMSAALDKTTRNAVVRALAAVTAAWWKSQPHCDAAMADDVYILPFRPLIVGGDDVQMIVHAAYAFELAKIIMQQFNELSKTYSDCWIGTEGELTISAGILYVGISFPLASGIQYADALLASAKAKGHRNRLSLPAIDWESVTEGALDSPAARRQRESVFIDKDLGMEEQKSRMRLTCRPYLLKDVDALEQRAKSLRSCPNSIRHEIVENLRNPLYERCAWLVRLHKNYDKLAQELILDPDEFKDVAKGQKHNTVWQRDGDYITTNIIDALELLQEQERHSSGDMK